LPALVFASQSPYPGWQNVVNSRNVMRNYRLTFLHLFYKQEFLNSFVDSGAAAWHNGENFFHFSLFTNGLFFCGQTKSRLGQLAIIFYLK
jgi:carbohydrate-selective porin OprB